MVFGSSLIAIKKYTSRGPVHPIPVPTNLLAVQNQRNNLQDPQPTNQPQEAIKLQPIQSISRIIHVAPINENVENHELRPVEHSQNEYDSQPNNPVSGPVESSNTQFSIDPPSRQLLCLNNRRYNKSMISLPGSILLSVILVAVACTLMYFRISMTPSINTVEGLNVLLPMLYFMLNPNHFIIVLQYLRG